MQCYRILGVDLTAIHGVDEVTAQMLVTEVGPDLSKFSSSSAFCNWLRLCPNNGISGDESCPVKREKGRDGWQWHCAMRRRRCTGARAHWAIASGR